MNTIALMFFNLFIVIGLVFLLYYSYTSSNRIYDLEIQMEEMNQLIAMIQNKVNQPNQIDKLGAIATCNQVSCQNNSKMLGEVMKRLGIGYKTENTCIIGSPPLSRSTPVIYGVDPIRFSTGKLKF